MMQEIEHEDVHIRRDGDRYYLGEDEALTKGLEGFHEYVLFTAAAAVYNATGSLNKAASLLWWAGFWGDEETLRAWVENYQETIIAHSESGSARTVAGLE